MKTLRGEYLDNGVTGPHGPLGWYVLNLTTEELAAAKKKHFDECVWCQQQAKEEKK